MPPNLNDYRSAVHFYRPRCRILDATLYTLCTGNQHDVAAVTAKVWLIARGYATRLEARLNVENVIHGQTNRLHGFIDFLTQNENVGPLFEDLQDIGEPLNEEMVNSILEVHERFTEIIRPRITGNNEPSFASKYLHFHNPAVPIYDSRAIRGLRALDIDVGEENYTDFVTGFFSAYTALVHQAEEHPLEPATPLEVNTRDLDYYLLWCIEQPAG